MKVTAQEVEQAKADEAAANEAMERANAAQAQAETAARDAFRQWRNARETRISMERRIIHQTKKDNFRDKFSIAMQQARGAAGIPEQTKLDAFMCIDYRDYCDEMSVALSKSWRIVSYSRGNRDNRPHIYRLNKAGVFNTAKIAEFVAEAYAMYLSKSQAA